jgi:hypothetical protein|nr:MAG TPA: hypothetical protein [Caudoviricetes sp.]
MGKIDIPENCRSCYSCRGTFYLFCELNFRDITDWNITPEWCPLKSYQKEDHKNHYPDEWEDGYVDGWNACLREITSQRKENY